MKDSTKNNFLLPVSVAFIAIFLFTPVANWLYDPNQKIVIVTPILHFLSNVWTNYLNFKIPVYVVLITAILSIVGYRNYLKFQDSREDIYSSLEPEKPKADYLNWKKEKFKRIPWSWEWYYNIPKSTYEPTNFKPVCIKCDFKMLSDPGYAIYKCPNCENIYSGTFFENWSDIKSIINQKIEKGNYPKD